MNRVSRVGILIITCILMFSSIASLSVSAAGIIEPRLNNTNDVSTNFVIVDTNNAVVRATYEGHQGITSSATIKIHLQRKVLFWWSDVEGASWTDTFNTYYGTASHSTRLSQKGEYRAIIDYTLLRC